MSETLENGVKIWYTTSMDKRQKDHSVVLSFANQALDSLLGVYSMDIPVHIGNAN